MVYKTKKFSNDGSSKLLAIRHALIESEKYFDMRFDICTDLDITSPLRSIKDIKNSISFFKEKNAQSNKRLQIKKESLFQYG